MILQMMCVFDSKAAAFATPFFTSNVQVALRGFAHAANSTETDVGRFPEDFQLYHLGEYDDQLGTFDLFQPMRQIATAAQFRKE